MAKRKLKKNVAKPKKSITKKATAAKKKMIKKKPKIKKKSSKEVPKIKKKLNKNEPIPKNRLSKKDLDYFKKKLLSEKKRVLEEVGELQDNNLKQSISDQAGEISRYSYHLGDTASLSYGREFSMGLAERQQKYLEQIDDALQRIEEGTYGICRVTGEPIPLERLEEVPVAKYSVKGKELLERQKK